MALVAALLVLPTVAPLRAAEHSQLTAEQKAAGWVLLFDGKTLDGWQPTSNADWKVVDGEIHVTSGDEGWLMTNDEYADYELHVEFLQQEPTSGPNIPDPNSGVFLRTSLEPSDPARDCYEVNITESYRVERTEYPTGSLVARESKIVADPRIGIRGDEQFGGSGSVFPRSVPERPWHSFDIRCEGGRITVHHKLIDEAAAQESIISEYVDPTPLPRGHIGLQFREGKVAFRHIRIMELTEANHQDTKTPRKELSTDDADSHR